jgi:hypothetical protein
VQDEVEPQPVASTSAIPIQDAVIAETVPIRTSATSFAGRTPSEVVQQHMDPSKEDLEPWKLEEVHLQQGWYGLYQGAHLPSMCLPEEVPLLPTLAELNEYLTAYFERFSRIWSFLHPATFRARQCPWGLLLAIAGQGARYTREPLRHAAKSRVLFATAKRTLDYAVRSLRRALDTVNGRCRCTTIRQSSGKRGGTRPTTCSTCKLSRSGSDAN